MAFKGPFIGIDRYASPVVNWLSCTSRDAKALHALFTDTLGGETTLLTDLWNLGRQEENAKYSSELSTQDREILDSAINLGEPSR
jgi:hypothetical protein